MWMGKGGLMEQTLVLCLLALSCPLFTHSVFFPKNGRMEPEDPLVEEGDTLILNCTLMDTYMGQYNASAISFRVSGHQFNVTYVRVLSSVTAQLVLPNVTVEDYGNKLFICSVPDVKNLAHQSVTVARRPLTPRISGCVVYNWERMVCTWTPTLQEQKLHHKLYRKIDSTHARLLWNTVFNTSTWYECPNSNEDNCTWFIRDGANSLRLDTTYYVQVEVENLLGKIYSEIHEFNSSAIVKPAGVTGLCVRQVNSTNVVVSWMPPALDKQLLVHFELKTDGGIYDKQWEEVMLSTEFQANFTLDVIPYTNYSLTVKTRSQEGGFWSDSSTVHFRSHPSVPGANPQVTRSSFEIGEACGNDCREITLHWKTIDSLKEYGPALQYEIKYKCTHSRLPWQQLPVAGDLSQYTIEGCINEDVVMYVTAYNSEGLCQLEPMKIVVSQHSNVLPPVDDFVVTSMNGTIVNTRWQHVDQTDVASKPSTYTLYWCKGIVSSSQCRGQLDWRTAPVNSSEYNISLPEGSLFHDYLFGIAVSSEDSSSGITWADCLYSMNGIATPPKHVRFAKHQQHGGLTVEWETPSCHDRHGYITNYVIYYCVVDAHNNCVGTEENITVAGGAQTHMLTDLEVENTYSVRMDSVTAAGYSHTSSKPIYQLTTSAGSGLSPGAIAGIVVSVVIGDIFLIIGVVTLFMRCCKLRHWYSSGLSIKLPAPSERRRSLQMSTASDAPLTGYDRWGYKKQISFSIRSADSGTGSLSTDENATPTYSENEISFYPNGNAMGMQSSPLMSGKPSTIGEEVEECDEVFLHNAICSPGSTVKKGGDTYVRVDANGDTPATGSTAANSKPNCYDDAQLNYSAPSGSQSYYNGGSENCYAFIGGFTTPVHDVDVDSLSGADDSIVSDHCGDREDGSLKRDHMGGSGQLRNKQSVPNPPLGGYVSVDATGAAISQNNGSLESPTSDEPPGLLVTNIDTPTSGDNDHRHGDYDAKARHDDWFVNNGNEGEHVPLVDEISDDTDSSSLHSSTTDSPQVPAGYVSVDSKGQPVTEPQQEHKTVMPSCNGYVTVNSNGLVNSSITFTPGQWKDGITNPGCVDYAKSSDSDSLTEKKADSTHTLPGAEICAPNPSDHMQNMQQNCDKLVPNSNGYVAINTDMFTH